MTNDVGLIYVHAYSLIQCKSNIAGTDISLVQCRNPHGSGEPKLAWSDGHTNWKTHPDVTKDCEWSEQKQIDDGMFWVSKEDWFANFNTLYIVKCNMARASGKMIVPTSSAGGYSGGRK